MSSSGKDVGHMAEPVMARVVYRPQEGGLRQGLAALKLPLSDVQVGQLLDYLALIQKWTKVYNLTAVRDPAEMLTHHLLDSLAVIGPLQKQLDAMAMTTCAAKIVARAVPRGDGDSAAGAGGFAGAAVGAISALAVESVRSARLLDVGSGAGLPGVVIAICCPHITVHCVDTVAKKAAFIQQVAVSLKLPNLRGIHARVESLTEPYDVVSSRAFASLVDFTTWSQAALAQQGVWMGMKGKHPADEMAALPAGVQVFHVEQLVVPGLDAERCIVWMRPALVG